MRLACGKFKRLETDDLESSYKKFIDQRDRGKGIRCDNGLQWVGDYIVERKKIQSNTK